MRHIRAITLPGMVLGLCVACGAEEQPRQAYTPAVEAPFESATSVEDDTAQEKVQVEIMGKSGSTLSGTATLEQVAGGVRVQVELRGVDSGPHGVHIHERGDCSGDDAAGAGDHLNPDGSEHGLPGADERHLGDLGNLQADNGTGTLDFTVEGATLEPRGEGSLRNRALVVHANEDTGGQPSGDAGARIGCAVILADS